MLIDSQTIHCVTDFCQTHSCHWSQYITVVRWDHAARLVRLDSTGWSTERHLHDNFLVYLLWLRHRWQTTLHLAGGVNNDSCVCKDTRLGKMFKYILCDCFWGPHLDPNATSSTRLPWQNVFVLLPTLATMHISCHNVFHSLAVDLASMFHQISTWHDRSYIPGFPSYLMVWLWNLAHAHIGIVVWLDK